MWKEIKPDDLESLEKYCSVVNDVYCSEVSWNCNIPLLQKVLRTKNKAECYYYEDTELQICFMNKYDTIYDRIVNFQCFIKFLKPFKNPDKIWELCAENCKTILERHGKIIRVPKYPEEVTERDMGISQQENTKKQIEIYKKYGIKVIDFEKYWEYELM